MGRLIAGLEPVLRKEDGVSGQKPRAGRWPGSRQTVPRAVNTPKAGRGGLVAKQGHGRREREIVPAVRGGKTRRRESPGGARSGWDLDRSCSSPHSPRGDKALKPGAPFAGAGHTAGGWAQRQEGMTSAGETRYGSARGTIP